MNNRNLIRFDWAIKRLLRNKADFSVLEGFLSELLKEDIIIQNLLESEGNQRIDTDKFNRVDMLVKNSKNELLIIEIQNKSEFDYFQRMAYGTSKVVSEYISLGEPFVNLRKVYSINIIYFDLGQGEDYIYHGKYDFVGIHKKDKLVLSENQVKLLGKSEPSEVFPEYYIIKVNQFDDIAKDPLDQWIYYLKNNIIKDDFNARGINKARELWRVDNLSDEDYRNYDKYLYDLHYQASMVWTKKMEVELEVLSESLNIARELKKNGVSVEVIMKATRLSEGEIREL